MTRTYYTRLPPAPHTAVPATEMARARTYGAGATSQVARDETPPVNLVQINADLTAGQDALEEAFELHRTFCDLGV